MDLAFSTLGCPRWGLAEILGAARRLGYDAIELRCLAGSIDLLERPELRPPRLDETRELFERSGVAVCCVDTSASFHATSASERSENVEAALALARVAAALGAALVRVFPNEVPNGATPEATRRRIADSLVEVCDRAPAGVRIGLETHGDFATVEAVMEIVDHARHDSLAVVWDVANTIAAGETIERSVRGLGSRLALVHLRDARPVAGERFWKPVLAGRGRVAFDEVLAALSSTGYRGCISFEWEKHWRPELEEPEVALADFRRALAPLRSRE